MAALKIREREEEKVLEGEGEEEKGESQKLMRFSQLWYVPTFLIIRVIKNLTNLQRNIFGWGTKREVKTDSLSGW